MRTRPTSDVSTKDQHQHALDAKLILRSEGVQKYVAVSGGICLPKGRLQEVGSLRVSIGSHPNLIAQADVLNRWSDGSVRWMLASMVFPVIDTTDGALSDGAPNDALNSSVCRSLPLTMVPSVDRPDVDQSLTILKHQGSEILIIRREHGAESPTENTISIRPVLTDHNGTPVPLIIDNVREEVTGAIRQVLVVSIRPQGLPFLTIRLRITNWIPCGLTRVETRIRNSRRALHRGGLWDLGDPGSFLFSSLELDVRRMDSEPSNVTLWKCELDQPMRSSRAADLVSITQHGSGGSWWNSTNHVLASGECGVREQGYQAQSAADVWLGNRAEPTMAVAGNEAYLAVTVPEFWQQFPGSISAQDGRIRVALFPAVHHPHELQGGEQKTRSIWISADNGAFDTTDVDWQHRPPQLLQPISAYHQADVFPWFPGASSQSTTITGAGSNQTSPATEREPGRDLQHYLRHALSGERSIAARREKTDEYGWRNFGDVPADHEQAHFSGPNTVISHYNNQFDMIYGGILQMCASGDIGWFELLDPLARHVSDIDIYHTNEDRAVFNGGLFWHTDHFMDAQTATHRTYSQSNRPADREYGGGPGCEHNYTTGLLHYYFLTGNPEASDAVMSLAEWVIQMDDGRNTVFGLLDSGPTGFASATVFPDFHGPGRGAGNSVNALLDAWTLTHSTRFLEKAEQLIRRCVHPSQHIYSLHLADAESHWSYTVFLNSLARYLLIKLEAGMQDEMYAYSRRVMSHYGRWMAANEVRTLSRPEELKYPNEAWAAQDLRKANVLRLAAMCEDDPRQAAAMRSRARELSNHAWEDLQKFGQASLNARCLAILMTEGQRDLFHRTCEPCQLPPTSIRCADTEWSMFVPQKMRVQEMLKSPKGILVAAARALNPFRWPNFVRALRRQL